MSSISTFLNSSVGKKIIMALTGLFLTSFLVAHLAGNLQLLKSDGGYSFNVYAAFMTTNPLIKFLSWGTYIMILVHAIRGITIERYNNSRRTQKYAVPNYKRATKWEARKMAVLGSVILLFIIMHMSDFWYKYKFGTTPWSKYEVELATGALSAPEDYSNQGYEKFTKFINSENTHEIVIAKDLYKEVTHTFSNIFFVLFYAISMIALAFHLRHGISSAFQSLGINHPKYNDLIIKGGSGLAIILAIMFAIIPIYMYFI